MRYKLQNLQSDILFKDLMAQYAAIRGELLIEENERLKNDPDSAVPESLRKRCLETIEQAFRKDSH